MGFPVGYPEILVPNVFFHLISLLAFLRSLIFSLFRLLHLSELLDDTDHHHFSSDHHPLPSPSLSALLIRDFLPVSSFHHLSPEYYSHSCAVCLADFDAEDEIRCMANCKHIFHRVCVDRWIDHDQKTCPLCRTPFVPHHLLDHYNQCLWAASGLSQDHFF